MEYVYTAMLLHSAGTEVSAKSVEKVLKAAGVKADKSRAEALVASLEGCLLYTSPSPRDTRASRNPS